MRQVLVTALALVGVGAASRPSAASDAAPPLDASAFRARVRAATVHYQDQAAAVADGYRLIGDDFPGMGEHWIHIGRVFDGVYDPERPEVLSYVTLGGSPRLLGIAYALPLLEGEQPPEQPAGRAAWHAHARSVDDETFAPHHHLSHHGEHGPRLAMLHAWVWLDNAEGLFAADNWAIPFLRLGLEAPETAAPRAGKALSLLSGASGYVARVARVAAEPAPVDEEALGAAIGRCTARAAEVVGQRRGARLPPGALTALATAWDVMWTEIEALLPAAAAERLASVSMR